MPLTDNVKASVFLPGAQHEIAKTIAENRKQSLSQWIADAVRKGVASNEAAVPPEDSWELRRLGVKVSVFLPRELHIDATIMAKRRGISLSRLIEGLVYVRVADKQRRSRSAA